MRYPFNMPTVCPIVLTFDGEPLLFAGEVLSFGTTTCTEWWYSPAPGPVTGWGGDEDRSVPVAARRLMRVYRRESPVSVLVTGGVVRRVTHPTAAQVAAADVVCLGGHRTVVSDAVRDLIEAANVGGTFEEVTV